MQTKGASVPDQATHASHGAASASPPSGECPSRWRYPAIHQKRDGPYFIRSDGNCYFLGYWWLEGAKIAYAIAIAAGMVAWHIWRLLPERLAFSRVGLAILPYAGDWIYRDDDGRCSSLAMFIDCDLRRRDASAIEAASAGETRSGSTGGESAVPNGETPKDPSHDQ